MPVSSRPAQSHARLRAAADGDAVSVMETAVLHFTGETPRTQRPERRDRTRSQRGPTGISPRLSLRSSRSLR